MNKRIRELALETNLIDTITEHHNEFGSGDVDYSDLEKFAELIIRECIERVRLQYIPVRDQLVRTEHEQGIVECGVASVIALEELVQESTEQWYKENILGDSK